MSMPIITLKEYRKQINAKKLDKYEDLPVVYAKDDEGNGYDRLLYEAGGIIDNPEIENDRQAKFKKAICIN